MSLSQDFTVPSAARHVGYSDVDVMHVTHRWKWNAHKQTGGIWCSGDVMVVTRCWPLHIACAMECKSRWKHTEREYSDIWIQERTLDISDSLDHSAFTRRNTWKLHLLSSWMRQVCTFITGWSNALYLSYRLRKKVSAWWKINKCTVERNQKELV